LQEVYVATAGQDHPDWEEYDQAVVDDKCSVIIVAPVKVRPGSPA